MKTALLTVVLAVLGTVGCNTQSARQIVAPNGQPAVVVECKSTGDCYEKAGSVCPQGYDHLDQASDDHTEVRGFANQYVATVSSKRVHSETWVIACKGGKAPVNLNDACLKEPISRSSGEMGANCDDRKWR